MLKKTVKSLDEVAEAFRSLYTQVGDEFVLQIEGEEDVGALKRAKDHEKLARQNAEKRVRELEAAADKAAAESGDVATLEKSWKGKLADKEKELKAVIKQREDQLCAILVDSEAAKMAGEISNAPKLLIPHIRQRMRMEEDSGEFKLRILDVEGKPSAAGLKDLCAEFVANPDFASIITGSKASGSGAQGGQRGASSKPFQEMNEAERTALYQKDPEAYDRLSRQV